MNGTVFLVGAGPGDPGLLTRRGAEVLATADVVVHDRLTDPALLALAPATAEKVDVGKQPDDRGDQDAINQLLVARARDGLRVVRLKGGDPFVFGRGGEEALALKAAGVAFEVVPGVSAAIAAPASAGVPVTHRGLVTSFTVVAGHSRSVDTAPGAGGTNWEALAGAGGTIVVLMGAAHRQRIAERLVAGGMSPLTPVLAVQWGTGPGQASVRTTLAGLPAVALGPPLTIVIGEVAGLDLRPPTDLALSGKTVVVTRAAHQGSPLAQKLRQLGPGPGGAHDSPGAARRRRRRAGGSAGKAGPGPLLMGRVHLRQRRRARLRPCPRHAPARPDQGRRRRPGHGGRAAGLPRGGRPGACRRPGRGADGLLPGSPGTSGPEDGPTAPSRRARPELRAELGRQGWEVDAVEAYRTVPERVPPAMLTAASGADAICFASSSAVNSYLDQAGAAPLPPVVACIGPVTAATARSRGLEVHAEASEHTLDGLVAALVSRLAGPGGGSVPKA